MTQDDDDWFACRFDRSYLELYAHRDASEAERATASLLAPLGLAGRRVLDVGCGAGRWFAPLERRGARVVGVDLSWDLLSAARKAGAARLVRADMRALPFSPGQFDLVLCMFTTFGYFREAIEDEAALAEMGRVLHPQGRFVLDHFNAERLRRDLVPETRRRVGGFDVVEKRGVEGDRIVKRIEVAAGGERRVFRESVRLWPHAALVAACRRAGLLPEAAWGDYDGSPYVPDASPRLIVRAAKHA